MIRQMTPVNAKERVVPIDTLRGVALGGVLLVNLLTVFRAPLAGHLLGMDEPLGPGGTLLLSGVGGLIEFKAFTLFSFLFGVGVAIQAERSAGKDAYFFVRRFGALLTFGLIHLLLVWNGDILTLYAACGLLLIPLLRLPASALAVLGMLLIGSQGFLSSAVRFPDNTTQRVLTAVALHTYGTGGWQELLAFRWRETVLLIVPLLVLSFPRTLGLMLWGVATWRYGLLQGNRWLWWWVLAVSATIGLAGAIFRKDEVATIPLAFAYAAAVLLWNPRSSWIASGGQMALTNYLFQSIVFGFVFYSYGLGYYGRLGVCLTLCIGVVFYCAQLTVSRWWLKRFYFGPFEWLWRCISYVRWQPFLREGARFSHET
jgi:uncharacterized protein